MQRTVCQLSLIAASLLPPPGALAADIVKCLAPDGQVTLTDQACADGAATVPLEPPASHAALPPQPALEHYPAPRKLPHSAVWKRAAPKPVRLAGDVATLKAARLQLRLLDESAHPQRQPRLAGLN